MILIGLNASISCYIYIDWTRELVTNLGSSMIQHLPPDRILVGGGEQVASADHSILNMVACALNMVACALNMVACVLNMVACALNMVACALNMAACALNLVTCALNMVAYVHKITFFIACV